MTRRRRLILWCSLAALSALVYVFVPLVLWFERVDATVTRGDSHNALFMDGPVDFRYEVRRRTYEVTGAKAAQSLYLAWVGGPGSTLPIYCNHWFPGWWRWDDNPEGIVKRYDAFLGLTIVFGLLIVRDLTRAGVTAENLPDP